MKIAFAGAGYIINIHGEAATQLYGRKGFGSLFPTRVEVVNRKEERIDVLDPSFAFLREEHCPQTIYDAQMAYFIECIRKRKTPTSGALEGLTNMKVVDAAYKSSRTGKVVKVR